MVGMGKIYNESCFFLVTLFRGGVMDIGLLALRDGMHGRHGY